MAAAPEWRFDPLTGRRVLISPDRGERPIRPPAACPFCEGHESETPPELLAFRDPGGSPNGPGWRVRVVPNRYAAVRLDATGSLNPGVGVAEVFVESPLHETKFRNLPRDRAEVAIRAWRDRLRFWHDDRRLGFALVFKNEGPLAGASVDHCHSQLIGIPDVPLSIEHELRAIYNSLDRGYSCPLCEDLSSGTEYRKRLVAESPLFTAVCPAAPRMPGETWICPREHRAHFDKVTDSEIGELDELLRDVLVRIARVFGDPDWNLIVKTAPFKTGGVYHWRIEVLPRTVTLGGWELGTGLVINTMFPEQAAALLRAAT